MNDHAYPSHWVKPKFFFGQKVSLSYLPSASLWYGCIQGMHYSHFANHWTYDVLISPRSDLLETTTDHEILVCWFEPNMILVDL